MISAALALAMHLSALPSGAVRVAQNAVQPAAPPAASPWTSLASKATTPPRWEVDAAFLLALGRPTTPGLALRVRLRLAAGLWAHAGASARYGRAPVEGGVREIPFELGLGYRVALGQHLSIGVRGEAMAMSRRMSVANADARHRWLGAVRGGLEARVTVMEDFGFILFGGAEGRLGPTEVNVPGVGSSVFAPVAPYFELGPSIQF